MKFSHVLVDIELTNRCNALCSFCPRDKTPQQGMISREHFFKAVERVLELPDPPKVTLTGQGEPTLHPDIVEFVQYLTDNGLRATMTSNASLMKPELTEDLLSAGLKGINFSISDFDQDYEVVYNLDFETSLSNALHFLDVNENRCDVKINIVEHDINRDKIPAMKKFWRSKGVNGFLQFKQNNRGGACENGKLFSQNQAKLDQAEKLMREHGVTTICDAAFIFLFVGWNGNYYVCCNDYEKTTPLGHVLELGFSELNDRKLELLACGGIHACLECDLDPTNRVREVLLEKEHGFVSGAEVTETLTKIKRAQQVFPDVHSDLDWRERVLAKKRGVLARSS